jgi:hypothetical protein
VIGEHRVRTIRGLALATAAALAFLEWQASPNADRTVLAFDVAVGVAFFGAAAITLGVPTARRIAYLEFAAGCAWFAGAVLPVASGVYFGFLVHVLATFPTGRLERASQRWSVIAAYVFALIASPLGVAGLEPALLAAVALAAFVRASVTTGPFRRGRLAAGWGAATRWLVA